MEPLKIYEKQGVEMTTLPMRIRGNSLSATGMLRRG